MRRLGVTTLKSSPDLMMVVHMLSPDETYDQLYVSNYARNNVRDVLLRLEGVGDLTIFGERQYSLRVWLDPEKLAAFGLTSGEVVQGDPGAERAGLGRRAGPGTDADRQRLPAHGDHAGPLRGSAPVPADHREATPDGRLVRLQDVARVEFGAQDYVTNSYLNGKPAVALAIFQRPGTNALDAADQIIAHDGRSSRRISRRGSNTRSSTTRRSSSPRA